MYLANLLIYLMLIRLLVLILIQGELKPVFPTLSVALSLTSSKISCFSIACISMLIWRNFIVKINFAMTYLTRVAQDWFKVDLN